MEKSKRILLAPLNWGLGHVTRSMPIINELLEQGAEVFLASDGSALRLLEKEYPELTSFELPSYRIRYGSKSMVWNMAMQLPRISTAILKEQRAVAKIVKEQKIDIVISDNRYGCFSNKTYNVFLTHQLNIKVPTSLLSFMVSQINRRMIQRFDELWVPDLEGTKNLSGELAHPANYPNIHYIGLLSRMRYHKRTSKYAIVIVLSGPEPQRTYLEEKICSQLGSFLDQKILLVSGCPQQSTRKMLGNLEIVSFLTANDLNEAMLSADLIVCRPGYSSLMDLVKLKKKALLIPTPGQTEQEYLAAYLKNEGLFYSTAQDKLNFQEAVSRAKKFPGFADVKFQKGQLVQKIQNLLHSSSAQ